MKRILAVLALASIGSGCAYTHRSRTPSRELDGAIYFKEKLANGRERTLSNADGGAAVTRIPSPGAVDINSTVVLELRRDKLTKPDPALQKEVEDLTKRSDQLKSVISAAREVSRIENQAVDALKDVRKLDSGSAMMKEHRAAFDDRRAAFARADGKLQKRLQDLYEEDSEPWNRLNKILTKEGTEGIAPLLQEEVDEIERRQQALTNTLRSKSFTLRIEAFLESPKSETKAIHLEGYDSLTEGKLERRDAWGLDLPDSERERIVDEFSRYRQMADELNAGLRERKKLLEAIQRAVAVASPKLGEAIALIDKLVGDAKGLADRFKRVRGDLDAFAAALAEDVKAEWKTAVAELAKTDGNVAKMVALIESIRTLAADWKSAKPEQLAELVTRAAELARKIVRMVSDLDSQQLLSTLEKVVEAVVKKLAADVRATWDGSPACAQWTGFLGDVQKVVNVMGQLAVVLEAAGRKPPGLPQRVPESFDVDVDQAKDTFIDLQRSPRAAGDRLKVRWSLLQDGKLLDSSSAEFDIDQFGWHATLAPSIVLVRPYRLEDDEERFQFSATLAWLHRYHPLPEQEGALYAVLRFLQPAAGIHAAFLNFDSEKEIEIGLGVSVAFWGDRLVLGAGYNLMVEPDERREGVYFFVGSSLIPLLQALGFETGRKSGASP